LTIAYEELESRTSLVIFQRRPSASRAVGKRGGLRKSQPARVQSEVSLGGLDLDLSLLEARSCIGGERLQSSR